MTLRMSVGTEQPPDAIVLASDWLDLLRLGAPEGPTSEDSEEPVARLLERGLLATGGVAMGARFLTADHETHVVTCGEPRELIGRLSTLDVAGATDRQPVSLPLDDMSHEAGLECHLVLPFAAGVGWVHHFGALDDEAPAATLVASLRAVAGLAPILIANAGTMAASRATIEQLREAMVSRSVIEQAKGVLMAREHITADTAWEYLVRISQRSHRKLREICVDIVDKASKGAFD